MADIKNFNVNGEVYDIKDEIARSSIGDLASLTTEEKSNLVAAINEVAGKAGGGACGITYIESTDTENLTAIRDLDSGTYVFYGRFKPFAASTNSLTFSSKLLVNVVKQTSASHVMVFYPVNNCVQYVKITDDAYERTNVYLNDLLAAVGTLDDLTTTDKTSLVAAINEVAASAGAGSGEQEILLVTVDTSTMTASHSSAEILEAFNAGKVPVITAAGQLGLFMFYDGEAFFTVTHCATGVICNTIVGVREDKSISYSYFESSTVPTPTESDYGKVLSATADGLAWVEASSGASYSLAKGVAF